MSTTTQAPLIVSSASQLTVNNHSINLAWAGVPSALGYSVLCSTDADFDLTQHTVAMNLVDPCFAVTDLATSKDHHIKVCALIPVLDVVARPLGPPRGLRVVRVSGSSVTIAWTAPEGAESFQIEKCLFDAKAHAALSMIPTNQFTVSHTTSNSECTVDGLESGQQYAFRVLSGHGGVFESGGSRIAGRPLAPPKHTEVVSATEHSVLLRWDSPFGPDSSLSAACTYRVEMRPNEGDASFSEVATGVGLPGEAGFEVDGLSPTTAYCFRVLTGLGGIFEVDGSTVQATPLAPVSVVEVRDVSDSSATLCWTHPNPSGANIFKLVNEAVQPPTQIATAETALVLNELVPGVQQNYRVYSGFVAGQTTLWETVGSPVTVVPLSPPTNLVVRSVTCRSVALQWDAAKGASVYRVERRVVASDAASKPEEFSLVSDRVFTTSFQATDLLPTTYEFRVCSGAGGGVFETQGAVVQVATLSIVRNLRVVGVDGESVTITWDSVAGAEKYKVVCSSDESFLLDSDDDDDNDNHNHKANDSSSSAGQRVVVIVDDPHTTMARLTSLPSGRELVFRVYSGTNSGGFSDAAAIVRGTTLAPVSAVQVTNITRDSVCLTWEPVPGANRYRVEQCLLSHASSAQQPAPARAPSPRQHEPTFEVITSDNESGTAITAAHLTAGSTYRFKVFAGVHKGGASLAPVFETTGCSVAATALAPVQSGLKIIELTATAATVAWEPVVGAEFYCLETANSDKQFRVANDSWPTTTFALKDLTCGEPVMFRVAPATRHTVGALSQPTTVTPLAAPHGLCFIGVTGSSLTASWECSEFASQYNVHVCPHGDTYNTTPTMVVETQESGQKSISCTIDGLNAGVFYDVHVFAGTGGLFETVGTSATSACVDAVLNARVLSVSPTSALLAWDSALGASCYKVEFAEASDTTDAPRTVVTNISSTRTEITSLKTGVHYVFHVFSGHFEESSELHIGTQAPSSVSSSLETFSLTPAVTHATPLAAVQRIHVRDIAATSLVLEWEPVLGAQSYRVTYKTKSQPDTSFVPLHNRIAVSKCSATGLTAGTPYTFCVAPIAHGVVGSHGGSTDATPIACSESLWASEMGDGSLKLQWSPVSHASRYRVEVMQSSSPTAVDGAAVQQRTDGQLFRVVSDAIVDCNAEVSIPFGLPHVFRVFAGDETTFECVGAETEGIVLECPQSLAVQALTANSAIITFDEVAGATGYVVDRKLLGHDPEYVEVDSNVAHGSCVVPGLSAGGACFSVRVRAAFGTLVQTDGSSVVVTPLRPVSAIVAGDITATSASLRWGPSVGATAYRVELCSSVSFGAKQQDDSQPARLLAECLSPSCVVNELTPGVHTVRIFSGTTLFETVGRTATFVTLPAPATITATSIQPHGVRVWWEPVEGAVSYRVSMRQLSNDSLLGPVDTQTATPVKDGQFNVVYAAHQGSTQCDIDDVEVGGRYEFCVQASAAGLVESVGARVKFVCLDSASALEVTSITATSVGIQWEGVPGATQFRVDYKPKNQDDTGAWQSLVVPAGLETGKIKATLEDLTGGTTYVVRVFAGTALGFEKSGTQADVMALAPVSNLTANYAEGADSEAELSWEPPAGATNFLIRQRPKPVSEDSVAKFTDVANVKLTKLIVEDLNPSAEYEFVVFACCGSVVETVGCYVTLEERINLHPTTAKEEEETIDKLMIRQLKELEAEIPGIIDVVYKVKPNTYMIGGKEKVNLAFQRGTVMVRVGGGYQEFCAWIRQRRDKIVRFISSAVPRVSAKTPNTEPYITRPSGSEFLRVQPIRAFEEDDNVDQDQAAPLTATGSSNNLLDSNSVNNSSSNNGSGTNRTPRTPLSLRTSSGVPVSPGPTLATPKQQFGSSSSMVRKGSAPRVPRTTRMSENDSQRESHGSVDDVLASEVRQEMSKKQPHVPALAPAVVTRLVELRALLEQNLISQLEFDTKKQEILRDL